MKRFFGGNFYSCPFNVVVYIGGKGNTCVRRACSRDKGTGALQDGVRGVLSGLSLVL